MTETLRATGAPLVYVLSAIAFFLGLKSLVKLRTAGRGRPLVGLGLSLALLGAVFEIGVEPLVGLVPFVVVAAVVGAVLARSLPVPALAARVAWIPGLSGAAAALAGVGLLVGRTAADGALEITAAGLAVALGGAGLLLALGLLGQRRETAASNARAALVVILAGWAGAALGFALANVILVVVGAVAGTAGIAVGRIVGRAAGQSFGALLGGGRATEQSGYKDVRSCGTEEAAMILETASNVVVIPGFGMAAAQAQHAVKEMAELLEKKGAQVVWAIHPSAGCAPGHMNIVLDEANVARERVRELEDAREAVAAADAVVVVGANDVVNPAAATDRQSPVFGLPVPDLTRQRSVFVIKRSLRPGATGVKNALFEQPNTTMIFGDAKKVAQALVAELKGGGGH